MNRRMLPWLLVLLISAATASMSFLVGCSRSSSRVTPPLRITINSWIGWAPLFLARDKGLFDGLQVDIVRVEDTGTRKSTMISGAVDGYASSVDNFALDAAQGVPGKIVLCFDESHGGDGIVAKKNIATIEDLRGKKIGFQKGLPSHFLLLTILQQAHLSQTDIQQVDMDADKAGAAFVAGHLDAAVTWEPWISKAATTADGKILVTTIDYPGLIVDALVIRDETLSKRPGDVDRLVRGWFSALDYWSEHKEESDQIMAKAYGLELGDFRAMCSGVRFYDLARNVAYMGLGSDSDIYKVSRSAGALWLSANVIEKTVDPSGRIDPSFVLKAKSRS